MTARRSMSRTVSVAARNTERASCDPRERLIQPSEGTSAPVRDLHKPSEAPTAPTDDFALVALPAMNFGQGIADDGTSDLRDGRATTSIHSADGTGIRPLPEDTTPGIGSTTNAEAQH